MWTTTISTVSFNITGETPGLTFSENCSKMYTKTPANAVHLMIVGSMQLGALHYVLQCGTVSVTTAT